MGRIKTRILKSATREILKKYSNKFSSDFEKNKGAVTESANVPCKKLRNIIAGYATRLKKTGKWD